jgi:hypothetical protein
MRTSDAFDSGARARHLSEADLSPRSNPICEALSAGRSRGRCPQSAALDLDRVASLEWSSHYRAAS